MKRGITLLYTVYGPEYHLFGRSRHFRLLSALFRRLPERAYGKGVQYPTFSVQIDGTFAKDLRKKPVEDRVFRRWADSSGFACVDFGVSMESLKLEESRFRAKMAEIVRNAAASLSEYLVRKGLEFVPKDFLEDVDEVLRQFMTTPVSPDPSDSEIRAWEELGLAVDID